MHSAPVKVCEMEIDCQKFTAKTDEDFPRDTARTKAAAAGGVTCERTLTYDLTHGLAVLIIKKLKFIL